MCGIFGYIGSKKAADLTIEGLKNLEYRGYDSWGMAMMSDAGKVEFHRQVGAIGEVKDELALKFTGSIGVGHSRWATHGRVNELNTHPHRSQNEKVFVVHNGIIDNYLELKQDLESKGFNFRSETDTEVISHLLEYELSNADFIDAIARVTSRLSGRYAFLVLFEGEKAIYAVRNGAPLIVGYGDNEFFLASDVPAFLRHTSTVVYMDDGEVLKLDECGSVFYDLSTLVVKEKAKVNVDLDPVESELGEYEHFMIKEIFEQKTSIRRSINQPEDIILELASLIRAAKMTYFVGCGTAGKVGLAGVYLFSLIAKKHVSFEFASEFKRCGNYLNSESLVLAISQSVETADTIEALEIAKDCGATTASIVNVVQSTIDRMTNTTLYIKVGAEKAVASTKATTAQLALVMLLAFAADGRFEYGKNLLQDICSKIANMFNDDFLYHLKNLAELLSEKESMYIIGKGVNYPIALESAIKLQEVSYIHAEGFAGGELKHGPLALISKQTPVIVFASLDENYVDIISNATEVKTRGGLVIGVSPKPHEVFDFWIQVPEVDESGFGSPLVNLIPIQLLSYYLALIKGNNPDKPRNLAKSVTVK